MNRAFSCIALPHADELVTAAAIQSRGQGAGSGTRYTDTTVTANNVVLDVGGKASWSRSKVTPQYGQQAGVSAPFYNTIRGAHLEPPQIIEKDGKRFAWAEFEDPPKGSGSA